MSNLVHMSGTKLSPEVVIHGLLDNIEQIKSITVVILWKDQRCTAEWSAQSIGELCVSDKVLSYNVSKALYNE